jgi:hypothetical protein
MAIYPVSAQDKAGERRRARVGCCRSEKFLDPDQLVVLGNTVRARSWSTGLDLSSNSVPTARSAMVVSSVSPERWLIMTAV